MGAQLRELRRRIRSVQSTKKITRAAELIASSRIVKAQQRVAASRPYSERITEVIRDMATLAKIDHPLVEAREDPTTAAVLVVSSDRGLAGGYNANILRLSEQLLRTLRDEGKEPKVYVVGRKATGYFRFRERQVEQSWTGFSEQPDAANAREVARSLIAAFTGEPPADGEVPEDLHRVDELHIVYTEFVSRVSQKAVATRMLPLAVQDSDEERPDGPVPQYEFEPDQAEVLDALLPRYVESRVYSALLEAAASESAARQRAMKSATDNADELIKVLGRRANQARQAEITQEIMEIVGGAEALSQTGSER